MCSDNFNDLSTFLVEEIYWLYLIDFSFFFSKNLNKNYNKTLKPNLTQVNF